MKRSGAGTGAVAPPPPEWDPSTKELWFSEFEREPVNDDKWSCIVTAAIQNEAQDEECIQTYTQCVNTGLRKAVKIISMSDIIKLLRGTSGGSNVKKEDRSLTSERLTRRTPQRTPAARFHQVIDLATKYATFTGAECKLHPELLAAVFKYIILCMKHENCYRKRVEAVRDRKIREQKIKERFIRDLKPYEGGLEIKNQRKVSSNILDLEEPINDEPLGGPDLYIMLTDFYNLPCFAQLQAINVPFVAILKISARSELGKPFITSDIDLEGTSRKRTLLATFWDKLNEDCYISASASKFKDVAVIEYQAPLKEEDPKENFRTIFDELTWTQYSVYNIQRQHHKYLQQLHVQKLVQSLEPLDLSKCEVYNKMCDALITGESLTPLLVLYAIVEQVEAGVPPTESIITEYQSKTADFFASPKTVSEEEEEKPFQMTIVAPCKECRPKKYDTFCDKLKQQTEIQSQRAESDDELAETYEENSISSANDEYSAKSTPNTSVSSTLNTLESLITKVLSERKTEKEIREDKRWKTPGLCFYGDYIYLQTFHCDPRLFDPGTIVDRFLKNSALPRIWRNHPEPSPEEKAFHSFHFYSLWKIAKENEESLKLKIFFMLCMYLLGKSKQYCYYENEEEEGTICGSDKVKQALSEMKLDENLVSLLKRSGKNFSNYFLKAFIAGAYFRKMGVRKESVESLMEILSNPEQQSVREGKVSEKNSLKCNDKTDQPVDDRVLANFYSVLNSFQISYLTEWKAPSYGELLGLIQNFKFYEKMEPNLMVQRLVEAQENYNAVQSLYFAPTDTLVVVLYNDFDERGIFCGTDVGVIPTPVRFRDFYRHVYPEIGDWLIAEEKEHAKFVSEFKEKAKAKEERRDAEFIYHLRRKYCHLSGDKKQEFLEAEAKISLPEVKDKELGELPLKPKPVCHNKVSFVVTNFADIRVENAGKTCEFHSQDGTQVSVIIDSWLYTPLELLRVRIKRSNFFLYCDQWLGKPINPNFTLKTISGLIFAFYKNPDYQDELHDYSVSISWPTGLMVKPITLGSTFYIRQGYLRPYRSGWEIEEEKSRCFLRNGQLLVLKANGDYDILFGSGTKYAFYESAPMAKCEIISTTGEVWQIRTKGSCKSRKTLMTSNKIFMGIDPTTKETFYKREDGTYCMLWRNGTLVTNYPDGTKITTTPYFENEEVITEWTDEEKIYFEELESKLKARSKTILRNTSTPRASESRQFNVTGFVVISCAYLMEHPKYASVYSNPNEGFVQLTMPEQVSVRLFRSGDIEVQQEMNFLSVTHSIVEFYMICPECNERTTTKLYVNSPHIVCKCVDFFQRVFIVHRDGRATFHEYYKATEGDPTESDTEPEKSRSVLKNCPRDHVKSEASMQRCFALERDLNGIEFLHMNSLSFHFYQLPEETYFELNTDDPANICHTFNSPYYKIGYEKWLVDYADKTNSLPTNLKKKDMKEVGVKQVSRNIFKYPFPKHHNNGNQQQTEKVRRDVKEPKVIVSRTVRCLSQDPSSIINQMRAYVAAYQEKASRIFNAYKKHSIVKDRSWDSRYVEMRLRKIALTLSQNLDMYPHLCTHLPSTEKDIHYFGHFINSMEAMKSSARHAPGNLPVCKQISNRLPRTSDFSCIYEENESPRNT